MLVVKDQAGNEVARTQIPVSTVDCQRQGLDTLETISKGVGLHQRKVPRGASLSLVPRRRRRACASKPYSPIVTRLARGRGTTLLVTRSVNELRCSTFSHSSAKAEEPTGKPPSAPSLRDGEKPDRPRQWPVPCAPATGNRRRCWSLIGAIVGTSYRNLGTMMAFGPQGQRTGLIVVGLHRGRHCRTRRRGFANWAGQIAALRPGFALF